MARYFVAMLVPRRSPGKKASPEVATAAILKQQGKKWDDIYHEVFPGYSKMPRHERSWRCFNLRRSVAAYLKRRRLRTSQTSA
jgi:hypothetical protein